MSFWQALSTKFTITSFQNCTSMSWSLLPNPLSFSKACIHWGVAVLYLHVYNYYIATDLFGSTTAIHHDGCGPLLNKSHVLMTRLQQQWGKKYKAEVSSLHAALLGASTKSSNWRPSSQLRKTVSIESCSLLLKLFFPAIFLVTELHVMDEFTKIAAMHG